MACFVAEQLLLAVGSRMGHDPRRALYPELLKRLDDSANSVSACTGVLPAIPIAMSMKTLTLKICKQERSQAGSDVCVHTSAIRNTILTYM